MRTLKIGDVVNLRGSSLPMCVVEIKNGRSSGATMNWTEIRTVRQINDKSVFEDWHPSCLWMDPAYLWMDPAYLEKEQES